VGSQRESVIGFLTYVSFEESSSSFLSEEQANKLIAEKTSNKQSAMHISLFFIKGDLHKYKACCMKQQSASLILHQIGHIVKEFLSGYETINKMSKKINRDNRAAVWSGSDGGACEALSPLSV
jgi:hypothetical protein